MRAPKVFLFDEPLSNLDAALRTQMRVEMARLHETLNATIVYVTHDQAQPAGFDRLRGGRQQVDARRAEKARDEEAGRLRLVVRGDDAVEVDIDAPTVRAGDTVTLGIRPEHFTVVDGGEPGRSALHGRVQLVEHLGDVAYVHALAAGGDTLTARLPHDTPLRAGAAVQFAFLPGEALVFDAGGQALRPSE